MLCYWCNKKVKKRERLLNYAEPTVISC